MIYTRSPVNVEPARIERVSDEDLFMPRSLDGSLPAGEDRGLGLAKDVEIEKVVKEERSVATSRGSSFLGGGWGLGAFGRDNSASTNAPLFVQEKEDTSGLEY